MPQIDEEKLLLIRGMIALAHVDGKYTIEEEDLVNARVDAASLPAHQRDVLIHDRDQPMAPMEVYNRIPTMQGKGTFLSLALSLFHVDGKYCDAEQWVMKALEAKHESLLDQTAPKIRTGLEAARRKTNVEIMDARLAGKKVRGGPFGAILGWVLDR